MIRIDTFSGFLYAISNSIGPLGVLAQAGFVVRNKWERWALTAMGRRALNLKSNGRVRTAEETAVLLSRENAQRWGGAIREAIFMAPDETASTTGLTLEEIEAVVPRAPEAALMKLLERLVKQDVLELVAGRWRMT